MVDLMVLEVCSNLKDSVILFDFQHGYTMAAVQQEHARHCCSAVGGKPCPLENIQSLCWELVLIRAGW